MVVGTARRMRLISGPELRFSAVFLRLTFAGLQRMQETRSTVMALGGQKSRKSPAAACSEVAIESVLKVSSKDVRRLSVECSL